MTIHYHAALECGCSVGFDMAEPGLAIPEGRDPNAEVAVEFPCGDHGEQLSVAVEQVVDCKVCKSQS